ncbi:transcriptional regulator domain-containing protein [Pseudomonas sp. QTF5]|uniref:transcriptional regulator domain-containing protein n=1 Tax=Pseudomonas sp. QTF5 TaxID=1435425 RepID=UPI003531B307
MAWKYLRRNPDYQQDWRRHRQQRSDFHARQWGLRSLEKHRLQGVVCDWPFR